MATYPATTVVMHHHQPNIHMFRELPVRMRCQYCSAEITTSTTYETGTLTWVIAGILLLFGLWLGCCLIPFCVDGCKDVVHRCPSCQQVVGKFNRM
ncbi:lipopolysaccharide-induced tumor necrosis factor-alpha factor homolog [Saccostrea cucullata]|uniref:lipopolysaccharide-induced tumor necrosis factor-alpha factor homolog n=1 Tax=Saccostrea cuccullata TaxID=36930 RepID=UPI002ED0CB3C